MSKLFRAFVIALLGASTILVASIPAQADGTIPLPASLSSYKFGYTRICVTNGDNSLPINAAAGAWNTAIANSTYDSGGLSLRIQYSNNCANLGYPANKRFTVDTYSAADGYCGKITGGTTTTNNGYRVWTNNPVFLVNTYSGYYCVDSTVRRNHQTSVAIGTAIGFQNLTSSGWASRVMCSCSSNTIGFATTNEGHEAAALYRGFYIGGY